VGHLAAHTSLLASCAASTVSDQPTVMIGPVKDGGTWQFSAHELVAVD
jgi:hypothetical protein